MMGDTKRYIVFMGDNYYPSGGWEDYAGSFETLEEAQSFGKKLDNPLSSIGWKHDWYQIIDLESGRMIGGNYK